MLNKKLLGSISKLPSDENFENVALLLSGDGTNGAQNNTFLDSSTNNFTITRNGNTTQGSFSPYGSLWSNYFNGSNAYLSWAPGSSAAFGTGDFTVECWVFSTVTPTNQYIIEARNSGQSQPWSLAWNYGGSSGQLQWAANGSVIVGTTATNNVPANTWCHIAYVRSGTTGTLYVNGTSVATGTDSTNYSTSPTVSYIGTSKFISQYFQGYISNVRIVKGSAVYTSAFTPSTTPLTAITNTVLLTCQSNRFVDTSSSAYAITPTGSPSVQRFSPFNPTAPYSTSVIGGSGYFDGSGNYLSASNAAFAFGTSDYTLEGWAYMSSGNDIGILATRQLATYGFSIFYYNGSIYFSESGAASTQISETSPPVNTWYHFAAVRSSGVMRLYINGVSTSSISTTRNLTSTSLVIGRELSDVANYYWPGYISNIRISNTARYSGTTLTVPTAPYTSDANTVLLTNFTNAGIPDLAMMNDLETVGNAQVSTSVKKYGTGSLAFDGTGDNLFEPTSNSKLYDFGTGDWTIEGWVYPTNTTSRVGIVSIDNATAWGTIYVRVTGNGNAELSCASGTSGYDVQIQAGTVSTNTWSHVAATRSGNNFRLFVNGTQVGSTATSSTALKTGNDLIVGATRDSGGVSNYFTGYIDDLRITKGLARYTTTFTPPASALPTY